MRKTAYALMEADPRQRAVNGTLEPVYHQGEKCGEAVKFSDTLLITLLKGRRPEVFRDKLEHSGTVERLTLPEMEQRVKDAEA